MVHIGGCNVQDFISWVYRAPLFGTYLDVKPKSGAPAEASETLQEKASE